MMVALKKLGYGGSEIERLNRVRVHQQVLFLSNVLCAGGRYIGKKYLKQRPLDERWSKLRFPNKDLIGGDFKLWEKALLQLAPMGRVARRLGKFVAKPHKCGSGGNAWKPTAS